MRRERQTLDTRRTITGSENMHGREGSAIVPVVTTEEGKAEKSQGHKDSSIENTKAFMMQNFRMGPWATEATCASQLRLMMEQPNITH